MRNSLWLPALFLVLWATAAGGESLAPGDLAVGPESALDPVAFSWPWMDLQGSLCGPSDTIEAADCKILTNTSTSTPGPVRKPKVFGESTEEILNDDSRFAIVRWGGRSGELEAFDTFCGRWRGSWSFEPTPQPLFTVALSAPNGFFGRIEAIVRFVFTRESDAQQVILVRTVEGLASGAWGLGPGNQPPGDSNLWLDLDPALPNPWTLGACRLKDPPQGHE